MNRIFLGFIAMAAVAWLGIFSYQNEHQYQNQLYHKLYNPQEFAGSDIQLGYIRITRCSADSAWAADDAGNHYKLLTRQFLLLPQRTYSVRGRLKSDGSILLSEIREHPHRKLKYLFSAISIPFILFYLLKYLRYSKSEKGFYFREPHA